jgi:hypothetical protein
MFSKIPMRALIKNPSTDIYNEIGQFMRKENRSQVVITLSKSGYYELLIMISVVVLFCAIAGR